MQRSWRRPAQVTQTLYRRFFRPGPLHRLTHPARALPDFIIIGAMRSGTTSLYRHLSGHPAILPAVRKEIHFFDLNYAKGLPWYRAHFPLRATIARLKQRRGQNLVTGEASPYYLLHPRAPRRAADTLPGAKLIAILRNPVDRAYSHYWHCIREKFEPLPFAEAIEREPERLASERERILADERHYSRNHHLFSYLARGEYVTQLEAWFRFFPRGQILILTHETFYRNPDDQFRRIFDFLEIPPAQIRAEKQYNEARYTKMPADIRAKLVAHFRPFNARLYEILGQTFDWDK